jgi:Family of unknown function (DUF6455)
MSIATFQWPNFKEVLRRQGLMDDMMERCGVDVLDVIRKDGGQSFVEARSRCRSCACVRICRDWLLVSGDAVPWPPDFCPNAGIFRAFLKKHR